MTTTEMAALRLNARRAAFFSYCDVADMGEGVDEGRAWTPHPRRPAHWPATPAPVRGSPDHLRDPNGEKRR